MKDATMPESDDVEDSYIGKQIGNYRITDRFDAGSFGRIYRATHMYLSNRVVAIKIMHLTYLSSPQERENFLQEARFLEMLRHPHILPIFDLGIDEGFPYIVAEFAPNGSLRDRIHRHAPNRIPFNDVMSMLIQVGQALHYVHEQQIVHRDLKPENILFNAKDDALIADFGIAVFLESRKTKYVNGIGSPLYMSPEQFEGFASRRSDQYALACIAYELLTGRPPFMAPHALALWSKHQSEPPRPLSEINPAVPKHVEQAILTALAKKREDRYPDVASFISDLLNPHAVSGALQKTEQEWLDEGNALFNMRCYADALTAFERAIKRAPSFADAYEGKGSTLIQLGRYAEALAAYGRAIDLDPRFAQAYNGKGNVLYFLKHYEEALSFHDQAIQIDPASIDAYMSKAQVLYDMKRFEEALAAYDEVVQRVPQNALAHDGRGWTLRQLLRYQESLDAYKQAIKLDNANPSCYNGIGRTLFRLGRYDEALRAFHHAIQLDPNIALVYEYRADTYYHVKRYEEALADYTHALSLRPNIASLHDGKGWTLWRMHRPQEALASFERAIAIDPNLATAYSGRGGALYDLKRYQESLASYEYALQLNPNLTLAYTGKGNVLSELGRYREALLAYEHAIHLQPAVSAFHKNRGDALMALGRVPEAERAYERARMLQ